MNDSALVLQIDRVTRTFRVGRGSVRVLENFSLELRQGEFVAVRGPSGCGKSTVLLTAGGLLAPESGTVRVAGEDVYALGKNGRARVRAESIGFVFQQFHLLPYLNVLDNVLAASVARAEGDSRERALALLERFGLGDRLRHVPGQLSTGEKQRVAMARALLNRPRLILADEPTGNLDETSSETILQDLGGFAADGGAVLMVTHDPLAGRAAQRTIDLQALGPATRRAGNPVSESEGAA